MGDTTIPYHTIIHGRMVPYHTPTLTVLVKNPNARAVQQKDTIEDQQGAFELPSVWSVYEDYQQLIAIAAS